MHAGARFQQPQSPPPIQARTADEGGTASRGLEFLLAFHRVKLAISHGQRLSIVAGSPQLTTAISSRIRNEEQVSRWCRPIGSGL